MTFTPNINLSGLASIPTSMRKFDFRASREINGLGSYSKYALRTLNKTTIFSLKPTFTSGN
jgi:hypothetical protein